MQSQGPYATVGHPPSREFFRGELQTEKGVRHLSWGLIVYILATLLTLFGAILAINLAAGLAEGMVDPGAISELIGASSLICGGLVLILVTIVLVLLGMYEMYTGKKEFGPKHESLVIRGVFLFILFVVLLVMDLIAQLVLTPNVFTATTADYIEASRATMVVSGVLGFIGTVALGLSIVSLVYELSTEKYRKILWASFALIVILQGASLAVVLGFASIDWTYLTLEDALRLGYIGTLVGAFSFIPFGLFLICYRHAYVRVSDWEITPDRGAFPWFQEGAPGAGYPAMPRKFVGACPKCGHSRYEGEWFCANCGARFEELKEPKK